MRTIVVVTIVIAVSLGAAASTALPPAGLLADRGPAVVEHWLVSGHAPALEHGYCYPSGVQSCQEDDDCIGWCGSTSECPKCVDGCCACPIICYWDPHP